MDTNKEVIEKIITCVFKVSYRHRNKIRILSSLISEREPEYHLFWNDLRNELEQSGVGDIDELMENLKSYECLSIRTLSETISGMRIRLESLENKI